LQNSDLWGSVYMFNSSEWSHKCIVIQSFWHHLLGKFSLKNFLLRYFYHICHTSQDNLEKWNFRGHEPLYLCGGGLERRGGGAFFSHNWMTNSNAIPKKNLWLHFFPLSSIFNPNFTGLLKLWLKKWEGAVDEKSDRKFGFSL